MPTPIAHGLAGLALYHARPDRRRHLLLLAVLAFAALMPDLDFIPGMLRGNADLYHHGPSHSLSVGLALGAVVGLLVGWRRGAATGRMFGLAVAAGYASHVILDMFCVDTRPPFGVPLFWPFWGGYVASPIEFFFDIRRDRDTAAFFGSLLQRHNLLAAAWEVILMSGVILITHWLVRRRRGVPTIGAGQEQI